MQTQFTIYIVGSLGNIAQVQELARKLRTDLSARYDTIKFVVHDDWTSHGPDPDKYYLEYAHMRKFTYAEAMANPIATAAFEVDKAFIDEADAVIMLQPCGKSAALELGYAVGQNKVTVIIKDGITDNGYDRIDIMEKFATIISNNITDFLTTDFDWLVSCLKEKAASIW